MSGIPGKGFAVGPRAVYGKGVYSTPTLSVAQQFCSPFTFAGKTFEVIFMNRINPEAFIRASKYGGPDDYWIVQDPADIRPYKMLMRIV